MRDERDRRNYSDGLLEGLSPSWLRPQRKRSVPLRRLLVLFWLVRAVTVGGAAEETSPALMMSSAPECTQCHLLWLEDFETDPEGILVPYQRGEDFESGREHAESSELMCYSCHDGYVADSRIRIQAGFQHPMAGISQLGRRRPHEVPLHEEELVYCGTCHTPHGPGHQGRDFQLADNAFLRLASRPGSLGLCTLCHEYDTMGGEVGNHAMGNEEFGVPDDLMAFHARTDSEKGGISCQTCHNLHGAPNPLLVILGGNDGTSPTLCSVCHAGDLSEQGLGQFSHPVGVHAPLEGPRPQYPNGEVIRLSESGTMNCLSCHDIHESRVSDKLLRYTAPGSGFCAACHSDFFKAIETTGHDLRVAAPDAENVLKQTPDQGGVCSACHIPHKGQANYLWARSPRSGRHPIDRLCLSCHALGGIAPKRINPNLLHPTIIDKRLIRAQVEPGDVSLDVPVYDEEGRPAERGWLTCTSCHDAHHWTPEGTGEIPAEGALPNADTEPTEAATYVAGQGNLMNSFLRYKSYEQICKHCHGVWGLWRYRYFHSQIRAKR